MHSDVITNKIILQENWYATIFKINITTIRMAGNYAVVYCATKRDYYKW